jgi:hypothetical protein
MEEPKDRIWNATMTGNHSILWWLWTETAWDETCVELPEKPTLSICDHTWTDKNCTFGDCFVISLAFVCTIVLMFIWSLSHQQEKLWTYSYVWKNLNNGRLLWSINVFIMCSQQKVTGPPKYLLICSHCVLHTMKDYKNTCNSTVKKCSHLCFHFYSVSWFTLTVTTICGLSLSKTVHKHLQNDHWILKE